MGTTPAGTTTTNNEDVKSEMEDIHHNIWVYQGGQTSEETLADPHSILKVNQLVWSQSLEQGARDPEKTAIINNFK